MLQKGVANQYRCMWWHALCSLMSQGGQLANEIVLACDQIACSLYPTSFGICGFDITMFSSPLQAQIRKYCAISASVGGAALVCGALQQGCFAIMGQKLARRLRITLMSAILSQVGCHVPQKLAQQLGITSCLPSRPRWAIGYSRQTSEAGTAAGHSLHVCHPVPGGLSGTAGRPQKLAQRLYIPHVCHLFLAGCQVQQG